MADLGQHYCLRWNNYQSNMTSVFYQLLRTESFVDVTLTCDEKSLKAHKVVLSACSSYFQKLLMDNPCKHPTIILPHEVSFNDLKFIIEFVYRGEIDVTQIELQSLLKTADHLKIKGLCEVANGEDYVDIGDSDVSVLGSSSIMQDRTQRPILYSKLRNKYVHVTQPTNKRPATDEIANVRKFSNKEKKFDEESLLSADNIPTDNMINSVSHQRQFQESQITNSVTQGERDSKPGSLNVSLIMDHQSQQMSASMSNNLLHYLTSSTSSQSYQQVEKKIVSSPSPIMSTSCTTLTTLQPQQLLMDRIQHKPELLDRVSAEPAAPSAIPVTNTEIHCTVKHNILPVDAHTSMHSDDIKVKFETLRTMDQSSDSLDMSDQTLGEDEHSMQTMMITPEFLSLMPSNSSADSEVGSDNGKNDLSPKKFYSQEDMDAALDALRNQTMSLSKAAITFGIPSTTLWQRAHRFGIDTPKKDGPSRSWNEEVLNVALEALRSGKISANKASKAYGIPSSTLYKIARREGIRLAAPFNAAPTLWSHDDLEKALESIRTGQMTVQKAATEFKIPTGTLYGRCKREKIELSRNITAPWSQDAMTEALEAIRLGHMSINQASIQYNLPYSSLYGRFRRGKSDSDQLEIDENSSDLQSNDHMDVELQVDVDSNSRQQSLPSQIMLLQYQQPTNFQMYQTFEDTLHDRQDGEP